MPELGDDRLRLRALRLTDVDVLVRELGDTIGDRDEFRSRMRTMIEKSPTLEADGFVSYGIETDGSLVGDIQVRAPKGAWLPGTCELGLSLFPAARGRGIGTSTVRLLVSELLRIGWFRVQAGTAMTNLPMRTVLEKVGFSFEGVMRGFGSDDHHGRQDYALYAILATDPT
ncbi:GNAT family N-acetyltransferase [Microlunatus sp. Gsoil 973]|uniref:GNAT family N-acetyltransferase n=1 Tax=Microlunatus sp. Gsoil 973 TaxID=2672569 RepID=UPI0012B4511F|nr:GNAT family protein [Microlunatus sp. Gsoil 973]QGN31647.1 GNAT family N-acetyltransferase [Microlunatus sp. Gsoil 973]